MIILTLNNDNNNNHHNNTSHNNNNNHNNSHTNYNSNNTDSTCSAISQPLSAWISSEQRGEEERRYLHPGSARAESYRSTTWSCGIQQAFDIYIYIYMHTHIHIIERERERERDVCVYIYIYTYYHQHYRSTTKGRAAYSKLSRCKCICLVCSLAQGSARSLTIHDNPSFRVANVRRRCQGPIYLSICYAFVCICLFAFARVRSTRRESRQ